MSEKQQPRSSWSGHMRVERAHERWALLVADLAEGKLTTAREWKNWRPTIIYSIGLETGFLTLPSCSFGHKKNSSSNSKEMIVWRNIPLGLVWEVGKALIRQVRRWWR